MFISKYQLSDRHTHKQICSIINCYRQFFFLTWYKLCFILSVILLLNRSNDIFQQWFPPDGELYCPRFVTYFSFFRVHIKIFFYLQHWVIDLPTPSGTPKYSIKVISEIHVMLHWETHLRQNSESHFVITQT